MPASVEVPRDVGDDRTLEPQRGVVPAEPFAARVVVRVQPVAGQGGQVDPAHERRLVVDDDELLVVAVERALSRVERHRDARAAGELLARLPHLAAIRVEERQRRARPGENAHVDSLRRLGEQLSQRRPFFLEPEGRVEVPAGEVDVRACRADRVRDPRQRLGPVQERLDAAARARRARRRAGPAAVGRRVDRLTAAVAPQPPRVVGADEPLDRLADEIVQPVQWIWSHGAVMPRAARNVTPSSPTASSSPSSRRCRCR